MLPDAVTIWTSPLARAIRTAEILARELDARGPRTVAALASGGSERALLTLLAAAVAEDPQGTLVLVGHEPDLGRLAGSLLSDAARALPIKKAGACALSFDGAPGSTPGDLDWFLPPRLLRALGARKRAPHGAS